MSDTETTDAGATADAQPTSFIAEDGTLSDGWKDAYLTEDIKDEKVFERTKTIQGVFKTLANAERMTGADKMLKPNDKFGDNEWDEYHRAGGWTGEAVEIKAPDGLPEGLWSDDRAKKYAEAFNTLRLNPKQIEGLTQLHYADIAEQVTNSENAQIEQLAKLRDGLLQEKGNAYAQFQNNGNFAIQKGTEGEPPEFKDRIVEKYGNDPDFVRLLGNLGGQFNETGSVSATDMQPTPADIEKKIKDIYNSEAFNKPMHPDHRSTMDTLARLHKEKSRQPA